MNKEMSAADQLRSAARLIDRALLQLDTTSVPCCGNCGKTLFHNHQHGKVYQQFADVPEKLKTAAARIENATDAESRPSDGFDQALQAFHAKGTK